MLSQLNMIRGVSLRVFIAICVVGLSSAFESTPIDVGAGLRDAHVVDLNVTASYALERVGADALLYVNVSVPFITPWITLNDDSFCPSVYLIDFVDPLGANPSYRAFADSLGLARSPCSALNFTYDEPFDFTNHLYGAVSAGWGVRFHKGRAVYSPKTPFNLSAMSECGVLQTESSGALAVLGQNTRDYNTKSFEWAVTVCQVGSYGRNCKTAVDEYAAACILNKGVANLSPHVTAVATGVIGTPRANVTRMALAFTMQDNVTEWDRERVKGAVLLSIPDVVNPSDMLLVESFQNMFTIIIPARLNAPLNVSLLLQTLSVDLQVPKDIIEATVMQVKGYALSIPRGSPVKPRNSTLLFDLEDSSTSIVVSSGDNFTQALRVKDILKAGHLPATYAEFFDDPPVAVFSGDTHLEIDISVAIVIADHTTNDLALLESRAEAAVRALEGVLGAWPSPPPPPAPSPPQTPRSTVPPAPPPAPPNAEPWAWSVPIVMTVTLFVSYGGAIFL